MQTFGANIDDLSQFVFVDSAVSARFRERLETWGKSAGQEIGINGIIERYGDQLKPHDSVHRCARHSRGSGQMWPLAKPMTDAREDAKLTSILKKPALAGQEAVWKSAYAHYRKVHGDPWILSPAVVLLNIKQEQLALYDNRKNGGPLTLIRQTVGILCCPMCGSPTTGTLDHYLPRDQYPDFSVLPCNLVPACGVCNSGAKGKIYKGAPSPKRFLQPYFNTIAGQEIRRALVQPRYKASTFIPTASPTVPAAPLPAVQFHLANAFGPAFHTQMATY